MTEAALILQSAPDWLGDFFRNVRIVDILDITLISFILYILLHWLRESASRRSLIGFSILLLIYIVARFTGMYLTEYLIEGLFVIILIGIVVVFQSDIRRIIDRLGNWTFFDNSKSASSSDIATSIITEAVAKMAENKTGALIAIQGKEDWGRHIHGGIELNGKITIPLLRSIFNKYAPGHDGAVLIEDHNILKFGVHLPLSTNLYKMSRGGTRHTAALGLSEHCDALVIVVSEERGTISIAQDGQIQELESNSDLKKHLDEFWTTHYQPSSESFTHWWKRRSLGTAIAAVSLAFVLWLAFAYQSGTVSRTYALPIEYRNLQSSNIALQDSVPLEARITLSGPEQAFRTFEPNQVVVSFDLTSDDAADGVLEITGNNINLPPDLRFYEASPPTIRIKTLQYDSVSLNVHVPTTGTLRPGLELVSITTEPPTVDMLADTSQTKVDSVATEPVNLSRIQQTTVLQKRLQLDNQLLKLPSSTSRLISIEVRVRQQNNQ